MHVSEIRVKRIHVNQGLGLQTLINEECRVEEEMNKRGGWNFSKLVSLGSTFIREMRVIKIRSMKSKH